MRNCKKAEARVKTENCAQNLLRCLLIWKLEKKRQVKKTAKEHLKSDETSLEFRLEKQRQD